MKHVRVLNADDIVKAIAFYTTEKEPSLGKEVRVALRYDKGNYSATVEKVDNEPKNLACPRCQRTLAFTFTDNVKFCPYCGCQPPAWDL